MLDEPVAGGTAADDINHLVHVESLVLAERERLGERDTEEHRRTNHAGGFGLADIENGEEAGADTIYGICSISKLFTGIAVMQLRDAGKLKLDEPLDALLPWFELEQSWTNSPPITCHSRRCAPL